VTGPRGQIFARLSHPSIIDLNLRIRYPARMRVAQRDYRARIKLRK
jgi:hypothetical protein